MRIALYTPASATDRATSSGAAATADALAGALAIAGHDIDRAEPPAAADGGAETWLETADREGRRPDLWMAYGLRADRPDPAGPAVASALGIPYVLVDPRDPGPVTADAVIALSDAGARWAADALPDAPTTRLLPFIDPGPYDFVRRQHAPQAAILARRHGLDPESPRLLFVGAMRPGDRLDSCRQLVRALSRLALVEYQLIVIGDGPARAEVEAMLRRLPLGRVHVVGALPPDEVAPFYAICDLLVAPCVGGTHGRVLLEAQATGLPVVAGDAPGVRDVVRDGMTGRLSPAGNAESIAQSIAFLLRERQFLNAYAAATTQAISKDHHIVSAAAALNGFLAGLTDG